MNLERARDLTTRASFSKLRMRQDPKRQISANADHSARGARSEAERKMLHDTQSERRL